PLTKQGKAKRPTPEQTTINTKKAQRHNPLLIRQIKTTGFPSLRSNEQEPVNTVSDKPLAASELQKEPLTDHLAKAKAKPLPL
ncbi:hypothetical protein, partial [Paraburkholderia fungorum]|uniref:hypothetical protein n=1 Tax=Paraburkholderia fungorum TaxID=134537 RepID=UPI001C3F4CD9